MFAGTALSVHLFVCADLSLFIIYGPYLYVVVCVFYAYNLTNCLTLSFYYLDHKRIKKSIIMNICKLYKNQGESFAYFGYNFKLSNTFHK